MIICFSCCKAVLARLTENTFLTGGFTNWKYATRHFTKQSSEFHKLAVAALNVSVNIVEMFSIHVSQEKRDHLIYVLSTIQYFARQGLMEVTMTRIQIFVTSL